jgi:hypothetical protein
MDGFLKLEFKGKTLEFFNVVFPMPCVHISRGQGDKDEIITVVEHAEWCVSQLSFDEKEAQAEVYDNGADHYYRVLNNKVLAQLIKDEAQDLDKILTLKGWE